MLTMHSKRVLWSLQTNVCCYWQNDFTTAFVSWGNIEAAYQIYILKVYTWKLYLILVHQYQPVPSFLLTATILVYPYLQLKHCLCTLHK